MLFSLTLWTAGGHVLTGDANHDDQAAVERRIRMGDEVTITPAGEPPINVRSGSIVAWQATERHGLTDR